MAVRTIQATPEGTLRREEIRETIRGVHVVRGKDGKWEVRLFAPTSTETFSTKREAVAYAKKVAAGSHRTFFQHDRTNVRA